MNKLLTLALALVVCVGTTAMLARSLNARHGQKSDPQIVADGAFRDGLYVGRLAAEGGRPLRPQVGRWSSEADRTLFVAGYRRGYNDALASNARVGPNPLE